MRWKGETPPRNDQFTLEERRKLAENETSGVPFIKGKIIFKANLPNWIVLKLKRMEPLFYSPFVNFFEKK